MKTTEENSRLIAEFMGLTQSSIPNKYWTQKDTEGITSGELVELKYHTSWDWLMPVVSKITSIFTKWEYEDEQRKKAEDIFDMANLFDEFIAADIDSVLNRCVEFIEWYNEENKF